MFIFRLEDFDEGDNSIENVPGENIGWKTSIVNEPRSRSAIQTFAADQTAIKPYTSIQTTVVQPFSSDYGAIQPYSPGDNLPFVKPFYGDQTQPYSRDWNQGYPIRPRTLETFSTADFVKSKAPHSIAPYQGS